MERSDAKPDKKPQDPPASGSDPPAATALEPAATALEPAAPAAPAAAPADPPPPSQFARIMFGGGSAAGAPGVGDAGPGALGQSSPFKYGLGGAPASAFSFPAVGDAGPGGSGESGGGAAGGSAAAAVAASGFGILAAAAEAVDGSAVGKAPEKAARTGSGEGEGALYCPLCDVRCPGQDQFSAHLAGRKHAKRTKAAAMSERALSTEGVVLDLSPEPEAAAATAAAEVAAAAAAAAVAAVAADVPAPAEEAKDVDVDVTGGAGDKVASAGRVETPDAPPATVVEKVKGGDVTESEGKPPEKKQDAALAGQGAFCAPMGVLAAPTASLFGASNNPQFGAPATVSGGAFHSPAGGFPVFGSSLAKPEAAVFGTAGGTAPMFGTSAPGATPASSSGLASFGFGGPAPVSFSKPPSFVKPKLNPGAPIFTPLGAFGLPMKKTAKAASGDASGSVPRVASPVKMETEAAGANCGGESKSSVPAGLSKETQSGEVEADAKMPNSDAAMPSTSLADSATAKIEASVKAAPSLAPSASPGSASDVAGVTLSAPEMQPLTTSIEKDSVAAAAPSAAYVAAAKQPLFDPKPAPISDASLATKTELTGAPSAAEIGKSATWTSAESLSAHEAPEKPANAAKPAPPIASLDSGVAGPAAADLSPSSPAKPGASDPEERELLRLSGIVVQVVIKRADTGKAMMRRRPGTSTVRVVAGGARGPGVELVENGSLWLFLKAGLGRLKALRAKKRAGTIVLTRCGSEEPADDTADDPLKLAVIIPDESECVAFVTAVGRAESEASTCGPVPAAVQKSSNPIAGAAAAVGKLSRDEDLKLKKMAALNSLRKKIRTSPSTPSAFAASAPPVKATTPKPPTKIPAERDSVIEHVAPTVKPETVASGSFVAPVGNPNANKDAPMLPIVSAEEGSKAAPAAPFGTASGIPASRVDAVSSRSKQSVEAEPALMETEPAGGAVTAPVFLEKSGFFASQTVPFVTPSPAPNFGISQIPAVVGTDAGKHAKPAVVAAPAHADGSEADQSVLPSSASKGPKPHVAVTPALQNERTPGREPMDVMMSDAAGNGSEKPKSTAGTVEVPAVTPTALSTPAPVRAETAKAGAFVALPSVGEKRSASQESPLHEAEPKKVKFAIPPTVSYAATSDAIAPPAAASTAGVAEVSASVDALLPPKRAESAGVASGCSSAAVAVLPLSKPFEPVAPATGEGSRHVVQEKTALPAPAPTVPEPATAPVAAKPFFAASGSDVNAGASAAAAAAASAAAALSIARAAWEMEKKALEEQSALVPELTKRNKELAREASKAAALATTLHARAAASDAKLNETTVARERESAAAAAAAQELQAALEESASLQKKYRAWADADAAHAGVRMECRPESADDFCERLDTFRASTWHAFAEVGRICPVECAKHGWFNSGTNRLTSTEGATVSFDADAVARGGVAAHVAEVSRVRDAIVATGHKMLSPWIGAACPDGFRAFGARRLSADALRENADVARRCGVAGALPAAEVDGFVAAAAGDGGGAESRDEAAALAARYWTVAALPVSGRGVLECFWCRSRHPLPGADGGQAAGEGCLRHHGFCAVTRQGGGAPPPPLASD